MPTITAGSKTLTIPSEIASECAGHIKTWLNLDGDTPAEILAAWSEHVISEVKTYLVSQLGQGAYDESMEGSEDQALAAKDAAEVQADQDLVIS